MAYPSLELVEAEEHDLDTILEIYNYYIATTTATFDCGPVTKEELRQRIFIGHEKYQTYLILCGKEVAGFGFFTQFKKKRGYDRTAEAGLYLKPEFTGKGIGGKVVAFLEKAAAAKGVRVLVACISGENTASLKLCERTGYERCAHYREVGEKFGRLLDVIDYQKILPC